MPEKSPQPIRIVGTIGVHERKKVALDDLGSTDHAHAVTPTLLGYDPVAQRAVR